MEHLKEWILWAWNMVGTVFFQLGNAILSGLIELFPLPAEFDATTWGGMRPVIDGYFPLTEVVGIVSALVAFQLLLIPIKWTFKLIPGMGG